MNDGMTFPVVELFGPTIQGEGMLIGMQSHFVRFAFCDFKCTWCDSMHAVDPKRAMAVLKKMTTIEIVDALKAFKHSRWVTLSGGNPALQKNLGSLIKELHQASYKVAVETQGTLWQPWMADVDLLTWSPKPPSSGMGYNLEQAEVFWQHVVTSHSVRRSVCMKTPIANDTDFGWAEEFYARYAHSPLLDSFVLQSVNGTPGAPDIQVLAIDLKWLAEKVLSTGMSKAIVLPQLHVLMWGNEVCK
jgi:7-carboxy-7-deazaguanine synthase